MIWYFDVAVIFGLLEYASTCSFNNYFYILTLLVKICLGMKVYTTDEKELIMEPSFKWAGNPNVIVIVKAFGMKASVQVI